jgi:hypothetical protein
LFHLNPKNHLYVLLICLTKLFGPHFYGWI